MRCWATRSCGSALALDEPDDVVDRIEVLRNEVLVLDPDVEGLLQEADQLEHARRVDDAGLDQRGRSLERRRVVAEEEVRGEKLANSLFHGRMLHVVQGFGNPSFA